MSNFTCRYFKVIAVAALLVTTRARSSGEDAKSVARATIYYMDGHVEELTNLSWSWKFGASDDAPKQGLTFYTPQKKETSVLPVIERRGLSKEKKSHDFSSISRLVFTVDMEQSYTGFHENIKFEFKNGTSLTHRSIDPDYSVVAGKPHTFQESLDLRGTLPDGSEKRLQLGYTIGFLFSFSSEFIDKYDPNYKLKGEALKARRREFAKENESRLIREIVFTTTP